MRITGFHKTNLTQNYLYNLNTEMNKRFEQIATGRSFNRPSDNPIKMNESMLLERTQNNIDQFQRNISDAKNLLEQIDVIFSSSLDVIHRVKEIAIYGMNEILTANEREILAWEIEQNIEQLVSYANTRHMDRYIFSGEKTDTQPVVYDGQTFVYQGNDKNLSIKISTNMDVDVSQSAEEVFIPVLEAFVELRDALKADDNNLIEAASSQLENVFTNFVDNRSIMGSQLKSANLMEEAYVMTNADLESKRTDAEGINMIEAYTEYKYLEHVYTATIQANLSMLRTTILDFL